MAKEVVGPSGEPITVVLLSGHVVINMCVYIHRVVLLSALVRDMSFNS